MDNDVEEAISGSSISSIEWNVVFGSVRGSLHKRKKLPNQDSILWWSETFDPPEEQKIILAIADGHGNSASFRSKRGSSIAVQTAVKVLRNFLADYSIKSESDLKLIKDNMYRKIPVEIEQEWKRAVSNDINSHPFSEVEVSKINTANVAAAMDKINKHPFVAYGTTLLSVFVSNGFIAYFQIGDGDILRLSREGIVNEPVPKDDRLLGNETTSLCLDEAWKYFRVYFERNTKQPPLLIMLSTDGYSNSFNDSSGFKQAAKDIWQDIKDKGVQYVQEHIVEWLEQTSAEGSGDDITLGIITNTKYITESVNVKKDNLKEE